MDNNLERIPSEVVKKKGSHVRLHNSKVYVVADYDSVSNRIKINQNSTKWHDLKDFDVLHYSNAIKMDLKPKETGSLKPYVETVNVTELDEARRQRLIQESKQRLDKIKEMQDIELDLIRKGFYGSPLNQKEHKFEEFEVVHLSTGWEGDFFTHKVKPSESDIAVKSLEVILLVIVSLVAVIPFVVIYALVSMFNSFIEFKNMFLEYFNEIIDGRR
jgi:hypothetical protein